MVRDLQKFETAYTYSELEEPSVEDIEEVKCFTHYEAHIHQEFILTLEEMRFKRRNKHKTRGNSCMYSI